MSGEVMDTNYEGSGGIGFPANFSCNSSNLSSSDRNYFLPDFNKTYSVGDGAAVVRIIISIIYSLVCALGLVGNLLVLYLMQTKQVWKKSSINLFVTSLAVTDFQFVLTLPFWAVENALDFSWLFGKAMCKIVSYVTAMNMYASVFFPHGHERRALLVSRLRAQGSQEAPALLFRALHHCLHLFPEANGTAQFWLGLYQSQKVLLGFVFPLCVISACYLLLLRFITFKNINTSSAKRRAKVTKSVTIVVLSFFLCWLPNQALTAWGILIKLNVVHFSYEFYTTQVYVFPVSVCLAHSNSCLNPILYCLMRREFRKALKKLFWRMTSPAIRPFTGTSKPLIDEHGQVIVPVSAPGEPVVEFYPPGAVMYNNLLPNST
ncbi:hypothetical protein CesoFtcFv8_023800 [Champsocephalus esox]|uniref:G-protein coupled receptors family 1 profile domain-containing protein n=1 Tax=Champsocephalus esox TaxID=159716 RepID=A0AAN8B558_9TELE|nr:hypothetical protein CesoFtcFv8_023800 [Champsocephalus esox]